MMVKNELAIKRRSSALQFLRDLSLFGYRLVLVELMADEEDENKNKILYYNPMLYIVPNYVEVGEIRKFPFGYYNKIYNGKIVKMIHSQHEIDDDYIEDLLDGLLKVEGVWFPRNVKKMIEN